MNFYCQPYLSQEKGEVQPNSQCCADAVKTCHFTLFGSQTAEMLAVQTKDTEYQKTSGTSHVWNQICPNKVLSVRD